MTTFDDLLSEFTEKHGAINPEQLAKPLLGHDFSSLVLLGFIRSSSRRIRDVEISKLNAARKLLLGKGNGGRGDFYDDAHAIQVMVGWHLGDLDRAEQEPSFKPRSIRRLAMAYAKLDDINEYQSEALVERLRKKYASQIGSLKIDEIEKITDIIVLQRHALDELERVLAVFGVDFSAQD